MYNKVKGGLRTLGLHCFYWYELNLRTGRVCYMLLIIALIGKFLPYLSRRSRQPIDRCTEYSSVTLYNITWKAKLRAKQIQQDTIKWQYYHLLLVTKYIIFCLVANYTFRSISGNSYHEYLSILIYVLSWT